MLEYVSENVPVLLLETMLVVPDQPRIPQQTLYPRNPNCLRCLQIVKTFHLTFGM
jgi:hypothetical protein